MTYDSLTKRLWWIDWKIFIFIVKVKTLPLSFPSEWTVIIPPFRYTRFLHIIKPMPIPSLFTAAVRSSLPNIVNNLDISYFSMPFPVSAICTLSVSVDSSKATKILIWPILVNLIAFLTKLMSIYLRRSWSPIKTSGRGFLGNTSINSLLNLYFSARSEASAEIDSYEIRTFD